MVHTTPLVLWSLPPTLETFLFHRGLAALFHHTDCLLLTIYSPTSSTSFFSSCSPTSSVSSSGSPGSSSSSRTPAIPGRSSSLTKGHWLTNYLSHLIFFLLLPYVTLDFCEQKHVSEVGYPKDQDVLVWFLYSNKINCGNYSIYYVLK